MDYKVPAESDCIARLEAVRWHGKPICPYCKSIHSTPVRTDWRHHCNTCRTTFSVTVGTIFHRTHLPLQKWLLAIRLVLNSKEDISARQLGKELDVTKDTAWFLTARIRIAMFDPEQRRLLLGLVQLADNFEMIRSVESGT